MAGYLLDSSALVKRYVQETGSLWVTSLADPIAGNDLFVAAITPVEIVAAITRRSRGGSISAADATSACALLRLELQSDYHLVSLSETVLARSMEVAERHGLRGYDAVQLGTTLELNARATASGLPVIVFVSADDELNAAALAEGLSVDNPSLHP